MNGLLEKAISELGKLSPEKQEMMAQFILAELDDEQRWEVSFASSQDQLARLAEKVQQDINSGRVKPLGFDDLQ